MPLHGEHLLVTMTIVYGLVAAALLIAGLVLYKRIRLGRASRVALCLAALGTAALLFVTGWIGDRFDLGVINSWALMHGSFLILGPVYFLAIYWIAFSSLSREARRS